MLSLLTLFCRIKRLRGTWLHKSCFSSDLKSHIFIFRNLPKKHNDLMLEVTRQKRNSNRCLLKGLSSSEERPARVETSHDVVTILKEIVVSFLFLTSVTGFLFSDW